MKRINIITSLVLFAFGGFYIYLITRLPERNLEHTLKSSFMPWVLVILLLFLSLLLLVWNLLRDSQEACDYRISRREGGGLILLIALIIAYILALPYLGFLILTPPLLAVLIWLTGSRRWVEIVAVSLGSTAAVYAFFTLLFRVQLPDCRYLPFL
jgi:hypothetical protein